MQHYLFFYLVGMAAAGFRGRVETMPVAALPVAGSGALVAFNTLDDPVRGAVVAVLMIAAVVAFSVWLGERVSIARDALYAQTYQIFILSWPFQLITEIVTEKMLGLSFFLIMPSMFLSGLFLPLLTIHLVNTIERHTHTRVLSLILGR